MTNKIRSFQWTGTNRNGDKLQGFIDANTSTVAKMKLREQNVIVHQMRQRTRHKKIKTGEIHWFSQQLATMLESGLPLTTAFDILHKSQTNPSLSALILAIKQDISSGVPLSVSLQKHRNYFSALFCNLIAVGEQTGLLDVMLNKAILYHERLTLITKKLKKALTYPCFILLFSLLITGGLLFYVLPQFQYFYDHLGAELPLFTKSVINLSQFIQTYGLIIVVVFFTVIWMMQYAYRHYPEGKRLIELSMFKVPILGSLLQKANIARFARTLAITFGAGMTLTDALPLLTSIVSSSLFKNATINIKVAINNGYSLANAIQNTNLFPNLVTQMITVGEETGRLESMLNKIADIYEQDLEIAFDIFNDLLEPFLMIFLGLLIGALVIAMYLPILKLGSWT